MAEDFRSTEFGPDPDSKIASYSLEANQVRELLADADGFEIPSQPLGEDMRLLLLPGNDLHSNAGRYLERVVFDDFFGNDSDTMTQEYGPYENHSLFLLVEDIETGMPIGVLRIISGHEQSEPFRLKTFDDLSDADKVGDEGVMEPDDILDFHGIDLSSTFDIATIVTSREVRGTAAGIAVQIALYNATFNLAKSLEINHWLSIIDVHMRAICENMGIPWKPVMNSEPFSYLGSEDSMAVTLEVSEIEGSMTDALENSDNGLVRALIAGMLYGHPLSTDFER